MSQLEKNSGQYSDMLCPFWNHRLPGSDRDAVRSRYFLREMWAFPLDIASARSKNTAPSTRRLALNRPVAKEERSAQMENAVHTYPSKPMDKKCQHPRVQVVTRQEDSEFVECLECREIFESSDFEDMTEKDMTEEEDFSANQPT